ncbi:MAG: M28 family peptidase [Ignavibacteriales bacterium]|nr:M28 family peptidase [Ignavibacteriales bacterium]
MLIKFIYLIVPLLVLSFSFISCSSFTVIEKEGLEKITPEDIQSFITFLASDSLKGRNTPSPGLDTAASFIAKEFKASGLLPVNGSYFQKIYLGKVNLGDENHLKISTGGKEISFSIKEDFVPFEMTANKGVNSSIVFAGYGITAPEYKYDDYKDIDSKGKIVFILRHEPGEEDSGSVFDGKKLTSYSEVSEKVKTAIEHGAIGVMIATDPLNHSSLTPRGFPWPSLSKIIPKDALPITLIDDESTKIPVVQVGEEVVKMLFGSVEKLKQIQKEIDEKTTPNSFLLKDYSASIKTSTSIQEYPSNNVVGLVEGSDPQLKNEVVILGAHYDHVGYKKKHNPGEDYIFNGADDNASGTAALMAIAKSFGSLQQKPKRSLLFIAFLGEELGLLGSQAYVNNPLFPLNKTVAMLNFDMVGRNGEDTLYIVGVSRSPDLTEINKKENERIGFTLLYNQEQFLGRSDQANFLKKRIPSLFYTTGEHPDYHKVTDEVSLIDFNKEARVAQLAFLTALYIANDNQYYKVIPKRISLF